MTLAGNRTVEWIGMSAKTTENAEEPKGLKTAETQMVLTNAFATKDSSRARIRKVARTSWSVNMEGSVITNAGSLC